MLVDPERYQYFVDRLIYLASTRRDLTYSVHILSQFMNAQPEDHWEAALKVVQNLKGTLGQKILLRFDCDFKIYGWCDSDWA